MWFLEPFDSKFTFLCALKEGESGHTLFHNWENYERKWFQNRVDVTNNFSSPFFIELRYNNAKQSVTSTQYQAHSPLLLGYGRGGKK